MLDKKETEQYFGLDALGAGILILHLEAENRSPTATFLLWKENMALVPGGEANQQAQGLLTPERESPTGKALGSAGAVLVPFSPITALPTLLVGAKLLSDASVIRQSFLTKEFRSQSLSPGRSASGFLYFKVDLQRPFRVDTLVLKVTDTLGEQETEFRIPVNYELH